MSKRFNSLKKINCHIVFYLMLLFITLAVGASFNGIDVDLWARLIMGQHVYYTGLPLYNDIVSYIPTHIWYDPEWLSSALFYITLKKFSFAGLTVLKSFFVFLMLFFVSLALKERNLKNTSAYNLGFYLILIMILYQSAVTVYTIRCQLITFVFTGLWILLLEKTRNGKFFNLYFLPLIMLFWLNMHGGCVAGVGILLVYGIGEYLNKKPYKMYFITLIFVCFVFLINPWGIEYIDFILKSVCLDRSWIAEWQSSFSYRMMYIYKYLLFCGFIAYIYKIYMLKLRYKEIDKVKIILIFLIAYLSARYVKHQGLFVIIFSVFLYEDFYFVYNSLMNKLRRCLHIQDKFILKIKKIKNIILYLLVYLYSTIHLLIYPLNIVDFEYIKYYPIYALEFLKANNIKGSIVTDFSFGSFIAYKYYSDLKIYMDGRQEQVYTTEQFDKLMFFMTWSGDYPEKLLIDNPPDILLLEKKSKTYKNIKENVNWVIVYDDGQYVIFIKKELQKFKYILPKFDKNAYLKNIFKTDIDFSGDVKKR